MKIIEQVQRLLFLFTQIMIRILSRADVIAQEFFGVNENIL